MNNNRPKNEQQSVSPTDKIQQLQNKINETGKLWGETNTLYEATAEIIELQLSGWMDRNKPKVDRPSVYSPPPDTRNMKIQLQKEYLINNNNQIDAQLTKVANELDDASAKLAVCKKGNPNSESLESINKSVQKASNAMAALSQQTKDFNRNIAKMLENKNPQLTSKVKSSNQPNAQQPEPVKAFFDRQEKAKNKPKLNITIKSAEEIKPSRKNRGS